MLIKYTQEVFKICVKYNVLIMKYLLIKIAAYRITQESYRYLLQIRQFL